jgi:hypothetical protein
VILVGEGKFGAQREAEGLDGRPVAARGYAIYRSNATVLQLAPEADSLRASSGTARAVRPVPLGRHRLRGEIVDSKCFIGAMKPGDGKAHKGCAALCRLGGIPPLLLTRDAAGVETVYMLADLQAGPIGEPARNYVGEPVQVEADIERRGDLNLARIDPAAIRPLAP